MRLTHKKRNGLLLVVAIIISLVFLCIIYADKQIYYSGNAIKYIIGESEYEIVQLNVKGKIKKRFLRKDYFQLKISVNDKEFPNPSIHEKIIPYELFGNEFSIEDTSVKYTDYAENEIVSTDTYELLKVVVLYMDSNMEAHADHFGNMYIKNGKADFFIELGTGSVFFGESTGSEIIVPVGSLLEAKLFLADNFGLSIK